MAQARSFRGSARVEWLLPALAFCASACSQGRVSHEDASTDAHGEAAVDSRGAGGSGGSDLGEASDGGLRFDGGEGPDGGFGADGGASPDASQRDGGADDDTPGDAGTSCVQAPTGSDAGAPASDDGFAPGPITTTASFIRVPISARALAATPSRPVLYALAAADDPSYANQLVMLDSSTGEVVDAIPVGVDPTTITITHDGSTLWVGSRSSHEIRKVELDTSPPSMTQTYALPSEWEELTSLVVVPPAPGSASSLIDLREGGGGFIGQVTLSSGMAVASDASGRVASRVAAGPPGYFFAYNDYDSGFQFYTVDASSGQFEIVSHANLIYGYDRSIVYDPDGYVYASTGAVIDVQNPSAPRRAGRFAFGGEMVPVAGSDLVLAVWREPHDYRVMHMLDTQTFSRVSSLRSPTALDSIRSPVALGTDRLAFLASSNAGEEIYMTNAFETAPPLDRVEPLANTQGTLEFPIAARALVADPVRHVLYAAVGAGAPMYENRVVTIDPDRGRIVDSVPVGSNPNALALSEDGSVLWVSLAGASSIRRIDLHCSLTAPGPEYDLPIRAQARRLFPLPGRPGSVAAQMAGGNRSSVNYSGTAFYDDGVRRTGLDRFGASRMVLGPPGVFFAYNDQSSGYGFHTVFFDDSGVTQEPHGRLVEGFNKDLAYDPDGFVYTTDGEVIDVQDPLEPSYVDSFDSRGTVLPLPGPTALMVSGNQLLAFDSSTFSHVGSRPTGCRNFRMTKNLVRLGPGRVAFVGFSPISAESGSVCVITDPDLIP